MYSLHFWLRSFSVLSASPGRQPGWVYGWTVGLTLRRSLPWQPIQSRVIPPRPFPWSAYPLQTDGALALSASPHRASQQASCLHNFHARALSVLYYYKGHRQNESSAFPEMTPIQFFHCLHDLGRPSSKANPMVSLPRCSSCHQDRKIDAWLEASNPPVVETSLPKSEVTK